MQCKFAFALTDDGRFLVITEVLQGLESVLRKTVRKAFSELEDQPFFKLLDDVYRTGKRFTGVEVIADLVDEESGMKSGFYLDFIYHPVQNRKAGSAAFFARRLMLRRGLSRGIRQG